MQTTRLAVWAFTLASAVSTSPSVLGQNFPIKPIRVLTPSPGSGVDVALRLIAPGIASSLGQQLIIDNRSGSVPAQIVSKSPPDGYTVLFCGSNTWIEPLLEETTAYSYDVIKDLSPIMLAALQPTLLLVHPSLPAKSVKELVLLAKSRPGALNSAATQRGGISHIAGELFTSAAGINIVSIRYSTTGLALTSLLSGEVQLSFRATGGATQYISSGRLRALAITSAKPSDLFPGLPTVAATLPGYEAVSNIAVFAPVNTPATVVQRLNQEFARVLGQTDIKEKFSASGITVVASQPDHLAATVKSEMAKIGKVLKKDDIHPR